MIKNAKSVPNNVNAVPNVVFGNYKIQKIMFILNIILAFLIFLGMFIGAVVGLFSFDLYELKELSTFTINTSVAIGAMGLAIFSFPCENTEENKKKLLKIYIMNILVLIASSFLGYLVSISKFINKGFAITILGIYLIIALFSIITITFSAVIAYFNIRNK